MATLNELDEIVLKRIFDHESATFLITVINKMDELNQDWNEPGTELAVPQDYWEHVDLALPQKINLEEHEFVEFFKEQGYHWVWVDRPLLKRVINDYKRSMAAHVKAKIVDIMEEP